MIALIAALTLQAAPAPVPAAAGPLTPEQRFRASDANGDGKVDRTEFEATLIADAKPYALSIWTNRDTNKDGWLTQDELTTNGPPPRGAPPLRPAN